MAKYDAREPLVMLGTLCLAINTSKFDPKLSVGKAKLSNSCNGQKAYRFGLIKCSYAAVLPHRDPKPAKSPHLIAIEGLPPPSDAFPSFPSPILQA